MEGIFLALAIVIIYMTAFWFLDKIINGSRSYQYRKTLVDMYVVAKMKEVAKKENINLSKELKSYKKAVRGKKDLDEKIEQELIEKVEEKKESK